MQNLPTFKSLFENFKKTEDYSYRKEQRAFAPVAKQIIEETLRNEPLTNRHLTGLIQTLKWGTSDDNFEKYLEQNIQNESVRQSILDAAYKLGFDGYTAAGKTAVNNLTEHELKEVKSFLVNAFAIDSVSQAKTLTDRYDALNVPEVKTGIYSPWLHYLKPDLFPIINNTHSEFLDWMGIDRKYSACIQAFSELMKESGEVDLAMLDMFAHKFRSDGSLSSTKLLCNKLNTLFPRIWRCADSNHWDDMKNVSLLTFNWFNPTIDYSKIDISELGRGQRAIKPWVKELKKGDLIFIMGKNSYNGICIANSEYNFDGPYLNFTDSGKKPAIEVTYLHKLDEPTSHDLKPHNNPTTFAPLDAYNFGLEKTIEYLQINHQDAITALEQLDFTTSNNSRISNSSLNIILYGPPGTGKTYHSIDMAVNIALGNSSPKHEENKIQFDLLRDKGQIEFVTFHQNYAYEDFIIGLKPDIDNEQLRFKQHTGIFYEISKRARNNYYASKQHTALPRTFEEAFDEKVKPFILEGKEVAIEMASGVYFKITDITDYSIHFTKPKGDSQHTLSLKTLKDITEGRRIVPSGLTAYYTPLVNTIRKLMTPKEGTIPETIKNFVLVIDEINRANISKVFGELITLLEQDKRLGAKNELKITLPNGEKNFGIPPNLYIIGTMNTADKSIALIDVALRRRFEFQGKYPIYKDLNPELSSMLEKINSNIYEKKKSADYLIGHAYLMEQIPIETILKNKIIPLLMEYFSNKTDVVSSIFEGTDWSASYNSIFHDWTILRR